MNENSRQELERCDPFVLVAAKPFSLRPLRTLRALCVLGFFSHSPRGACAATRHRPPSCFGRPSQVFLDESRTQVHVDLDQRRITYRLEAVNLARLDHKNISRSSLERLAIDRPHSLAFTNKLDFVVGMPMRTRSRTRFSMEQEHRNAGVPLHRANKLMGTAHKRKVLLTHVMHALRSSCQHWMSYNTLWFRPSRSSAFLRALCEPSA